MATRGPHAAARARNLAMPRVPMFVGDPAGEAITAGVMAGVAPSLTGRAGHIIIGDPSSMERAWHGYANNPQPELEARAFTARRGTTAVFTNGPNDVAGMPSTQAGQPYLDARYRALAARMVRG